MGRRDQSVRMADAAIRGFGLADVTPGFLKPRAALYVDGYNLFHALLDQGRREWLWLDLKTLAKGIIRPEERLASVTWVSAHRPDRKGRMQAMFAYEQALRARKVRCLMGHFVVHGDWCQNCGHRWMSATEKQSDVNLALALTSDAAADRFDVAYLLTTDGDHAATARFLRETYPDKGLIAVSPPGRGHNRQISAWVDGVVGIGPNLVERSMLPDRIKTKTGWVERPLNWARPEPAPPPPEPTPPETPRADGKGGHLRLVVSN